MPDSNYNALANKLKKNIDVLENTFESNNLQILNFSIRADKEGQNGSVHFYLEISTIEGTRIARSLNIKLNLYDENDDIFFVQTQKLDSDCFNGYDTIEFYTFGYDRALDYATKGRLYVTVGW